METTARNIVKVLKFYGALGFERLPLEMPVASYGSSADKAEALERLRLDIGECLRCKLSMGRKNVVFGEGNPDARLMFIGEGPGKEEDMKARPFVGDAGQLLDRLINRMGLNREEVYIANVVKCRPPGNRDPEEDETATCIPFLKAQIGIIQPEVIMTLGRISAHALLGTSTPISRLRGKWMELDGVPVMPTFHPAYLLRNPKDKNLTWADAVQALKKLGLEVPAQ